MKCCFENAEAVLEGLGFVADELGIEVVSEAEAELTVTVCETDSRTLHVALDGNRASISYGNGKALFFRGLATLTGWVKGGTSQQTLTEAPLFESNGTMVDMSRNAVMTVSTVKLMLRKVALMGMNTFMLYTEDTYEIEENPYFGYMRGRYTHAELKELDRYALALGVELIPCIQVLGHLATHLRWASAKRYKDTKNVLLVGADETYQLIDRMLKAVSECFTTRRLHIGMDETHDLGTGAYLDQNGYRLRQEIYFEHLERVRAMAESYGLCPMMWSDMFFRMAGAGLEGFRDYDVRVTFDEETCRKIPKGLQQVFWNYYNADESFYATNIQKHHEIFGEMPVFAGGVWCWSGFAPLFSRSLRFTVPALDACRKQGVREVLGTVWHNGSECSLILSLAGLAWYADYNYRGCYDEQGVRTCFENACGVSYDAILQCELPEHPDGGLLALTRSLVYNDPLLGLADRHFAELPLRAYYETVTEKLHADAGALGVFAPAYDTVSRVSELLVRKADFGIRLKAAYDKGDKAELQALLAECDEIAERIRALHDSHRASWMQYNKPFGFEVHDIRYGGLLARFETVKQRLGAYLAGEITCIEELEQKRLRMDGRLEEDAVGCHERFNWMDYKTYATAGIL